MKFSSNFQNAMLEVELEKSLVAHGGKHGVTGFVEDAASNAKGNSVSCPGNGT